MGAGTLVGTGHLDFWPVFLATTIGAIAGDQVSYWAGRLFGERLKQFWPLSRYPALVAKGEDFVRKPRRQIDRHRPLRAGRESRGARHRRHAGHEPALLCLRQCHERNLLGVLPMCFPGILIGQGLGLGRRVQWPLDLPAGLAAGDAGRSRLGYPAVSRRAFSRPSSAACSQGLSRLAKARKSRPFYRLGRKPCRPTIPKAARIVAMVLSLVIAAAIATYLFIRVGTLDAASNLDQSVFGILSDLRNAPADLLMTRISMTGEAPVLLTLCSRHGGLAAHPPCLAHGAGGGRCGCRRTGPGGAVEACLCPPAPHRAAARCL